jgi:hypothetical protein
MQSAYTAGGFPDYRTEQMATILTEHYSTNAATLLDSKAEVNTAIEEIVETCTTKLLESRRAPIAAYKKRLEQ